MYRWDNMSMQFNTNIRFPKSACYFVILQIKFFIFEIYRFFVTVHDKFQIVCISLED